MTERSLDEFGTETDDAEPSVPTMRWSDEGDSCADCGESVARRWRAEDGFVCADCKDW